MRELGKQDQFSRGNVNTDNNPEMTKISGLSKVLRSSYYYHKEKKNTLAMNEKIGNLRREIEIEKKNHMEILELKNRTREMEEVTEWHP